MSIQLKLIAACLGSLMVIALLGGVAELQVSRMGQLAMNIYDHGFMGMSYVDQAQQDYLRALGRYAAADPAVGAAPFQKSLADVLDKLDVAIERAASPRTRASGLVTRDVISGMLDLPATELARRLPQGDVAMSRLVARFQSDGLQQRDDAQALARLGWMILMGGFAVAMIVVVAIAWLVGRSLARPLTAVVATLRDLTAGKIGATLHTTLLARVDEIGEVARATALFSESLRHNRQADQARRSEQEAAEKSLLLLRAAEAIELETAEIGQRAANCSVMLSAHADSLAASATRVLASVADVSRSTGEALAGSEIVAAAGDDLRVTASAVAEQMQKAAAEASCATMAGTQVRLMIERLSGATGEISGFASSIGNIAARSKMLALNASIEATRSGEAGRGFAVVADEVKLLAAQTAQSTQNIRQSANDIHLATCAAVSAVDEMMERASAIENINVAVAVAAQKQVAATGQIANNVSASAMALRAVAQQVNIVSHEANETADAMGKLHGISTDIVSVVHALRAAVTRTLVEQHGSDPGVGVILADKHAG